MAVAAAELRKLAHQLGVDAASLDFLSSMDGADLRVLRRRIGDYLFETDKHHFSKVAAVSRVVPTALAARVTEFALPPVLAARTAELLEPARAVDMVMRLSDRYLADVSAAMDPSRAPEVIARMPPDKVARVGAELAGRGEWVVMGGFVSAVSGPALRAAVEGLTGEQLLRIGYVLDDLDRMDDIAAMLTDTQLDDLLAAAVDQDLWTELDGVLTSVTGDQSARLASRYAAAPPSVRAALDSGALSADARAALCR